MQEPSVHVTVRTAACNRAAHPETKNALHEHAELPSEREHPHPRRAARRRCSTPAATPMERAALRRVIGPPTNLGFANLLVHHDGPAESEATA